MLGEFYMKVVEEPSKKENVIRIDKRMEGATVFIFFRPKSEEMYPYRICNQTQYTMVFWQEQVPLHPYSFLFLFS